MSKALNTKRILFHFSVTTLMYFIVSVPHAAPLDKNRIGFPYISRQCSRDNTVKDCRKVSIKHGARASGSVDRAEHQHCDGRARRGAGAIEPRFVVICARGERRPRRAADAPTYDGSYPPSREPLRAS